MDCEITIDDSRIAELGAKLPLAVERTMVMIAQFTEGEAIDEGEDGKAVPKVTSNLAQSLTLTQQGSGFETEMTLAVGPSGMPYGEWVHNGTGIYRLDGGGEPWVVRPKHKRAAGKKGGPALAIPVPGGGVVYRAYAFIKGMKPRPFFLWAIDATVPHVQGIGDLAFNAVLQS